MKCITIINTLEKWFWLFDYSPLYTTAIVSTRSHCLTHSCSGCITPSSTILYWSHFLKNTSFVSSFTHSCSDFFELFMASYEQARNVLRGRGLIFDIRPKNALFMASESWPFLAKFGCRNYSCCVVLFQPQTFSLIIQPQITTYWTAITTVS